MRRYRRDNRARRTSEAGMIVAIMIIVGLISVAATLVAI